MSEFPSLSGTERSTRSDLSSIRVTALAICHDRHGRVLVERGHDSVTDEHFLRGIGGGVRPGERAADALRREWREELGLSLCDVQLIGALENFYVYLGIPGHEIVLLFHAKIVEQWPYERDEFVVTESCEGDSSMTHSAVWLDPASAAGSGVRIAPAGFFDAGNYFSGRSFGMRVDRPGE